MTTREHIIEIVNKLFIYTDSRNWIGLQNEVFTDRVFLDMTSLGGDAKELHAKEICDMWKIGFKDIDQINHLGGNYIVKIISDELATVFAYATATHFKASAEKGKTREFIGSYDFKLKNIENSWKIYSFVYNLKYMTGNIELS